MTASKRIAEAALLYQTGGLTLFDSAPGKCLKVVRILIQIALNLSYEEFYRRYRTVAADDVDGTPRPLSAPGQPGFNPWARDMQASLRDSPYAQRVRWEERAPGDLVFSWDLAREGHVAIISARVGEVTQVIENTGSQRGRVLSGYNRQSRLEDWPTKHYEVFRLIEA